MGRTGDPVQDLFRGWGLRTGRMVNGWTVASVQLKNDPTVGTTATVRFARDSQSFCAHFRVAGSVPRFARVGAIDISHDKVASELNVQVGIVLKLLTAWLKRKGDETKLAALLADAALQAPQETSRRECENLGVPRSGESVPPQARSADGEPQPTNGGGGLGPQPYVIVHEAPPLDPAKKAPPDRPVLDFEFIDVADLHRYPDALREIYNGTRGGIVVRGVYSKDEMARVVARLDQSQEKFPQMLLPPSQKSYFLGLCLEGGDPSLSAYLQAAERFRQETLPVFDGMEPFEERVERLFRSVSGGRTVELARFGDGRPYTPATIRILPVGGQLAPHCGNEMFNRPSYTHLQTIVDEYDQISYFLTLQEAEEGGGLIIYSLKWTEVGADNILPDGRSNVGSLLGEAEWMEVRPSAGDVLMFDGGRYLHRVDWVGGGRTRWTMGGFLMFDQSGEKLLYWA
jgi:hypothetical protein